MLALVITVVVLMMICVPTILWAWSILGSTKAPFVPLSKEALPAIATALKIEVGNLVYDMGCGDGRVLFACADAHPDAKFIGIEKALFPVLLARLRRRSKTVTVQHADMFKVSVADADRIVLYLLPVLMDDVEQKLVRELKPGTRVIAVDFPFKDRKPDEVIEQMQLSPRVRGRMLYVYHF